VTVLVTNTINCSSTLPSQSLSRPKDGRRAGEGFLGAGGERAWKFTGEVAQMTLSGKIQIDMAYLSNKTLYASSFFVATDMGYTKHFFAGAERVCSKLGGGMALAPTSVTDSMVDPLESDYEEISNQLSVYLERFANCAPNELKVYFDLDPVLYGITGDMLERNDFEEQQYFFHPDHLGSSSFISDAGGQAYQHLQYMPFGETFISQKVDTWGTLYQFSGKEKDDETGFSYFGARYYNSDVSVWLNVDPLSDKYPSTSAFMYVLGRPTALIDPNGMNAWDPPTKEGGVWTAKAGDSPGSLARDAKISQSEAEEIMRKHNANQKIKRSSDIMVYAGDQVVVPEKSTTSTQTSIMSNSNQPSSEGNNLPVLPENTIAALNALAGLAEMGKVSGDMWYSVKAGKWYPISNQPNGTTGPRNSVLESARRWKNIGKGTFVVGAVYSTADAIYYYSTGGSGWEKTAWTAADVAVGAISTWGGAPGIAIGIVYVIGTNPPSFIKVSPYITDPLSPWNSASRIDNTGINNHGGF